jgi:hypothetical protein
MTIVNVGLDTAEEPTQGDLRTWVWSTADPCRALAGTGTALAQRRPRRLVSACAVLRSPMALTCADYLGWS